MSPADLADDAEECSKLHYFADKRQLPHSRVMQFMFMQQSCERTCSLITCSALALPLHVNGLCLPQITLMTQRECSKLHYFADKRQLPHSADNAVHVYVTKLWGEHARSFLVTSLVLPLHVNGLFSRRSRWWRRGNAASCIITQIKDSCHIVETMLFMFIQQRCEGTCSFILCSSLALSLLFPYMWTAYVSRRSRWWRRGMQQAALFRRQKTVAS